MIQSERVGRLTLKSCRVPRELVLVNGNSPLPLQRIWGNVELGESHPHGREHRTRRQRYLASAKIINLNLVRVAAFPAEFGVNWQSGTG